MDEVNIHNFVEMNREEFTDFPLDKIHTYSDFTFPQQYTIIARPSATVTSAIQKVIQKLRAIEPDHFYYPVENIHLTLLGGIQKNINHQKTLDAVQEICTQSPLNFRLQGIRPTSPMLAYPTNFSMHTLREQLREAIKETGEGYRDANIYFEYLGWINIMRFLHKPSQAFFEAMSEFHSTSFGEFQPTSIEVYKTISKVLDQKHTVLLRKINLKSYRC